MASKNGVAPAPRASFSLRAAVPPPVPARRVTRLWRHRFRFIVLVTGFMLCTALSLNANLYNFALLCMQQEDEAEDLQNPTETAAELQRQQAPQWAMAGGVLLGAFPFVQVHARLTLFWAAILSAIATAAVPLAVHTGFWLFFGVRVLQGIAYAADFGALGMLCSQWGSLAEQGLFLSVASSFSPASVSLGNSVAGLALFGSGVIWVCWLNAFADLCSGVFLLMYKPEYFHFVLGYSTLDTGWMTGLTSALHIPLKLISGWASDRIGFLSERTKLRLFNTISVGFAGLSYVGVSFAPSPWFAFLCFCASSMFMAFAGGGFYKCAALHSRQYNHLVMAGIQLNKCAVLFIGPLLVSVTVHDVANALQWRTIFLAFAVLCFSANALFCMVATDRPADFTTDQYHERRWKKLSGKELILRRTF